MTTPCKKKGYKLGQVFSVIDSGSGSFSGESIVALSRDDGTDCPKFDLIEGGCTNDGGVLTTRGGYVALRHVKRIYPPEVVTETIELMGKTYDKAEIEKALSSVKALGE